MQANEITKLTDREHILLRPAMYLGATSEVESTEYIISEGKIEQKLVRSVPGFLKIVSEIIDNSVDEGVRTGFKFSNRIQVEIDDFSVLIKDNGRGIPVKNVAGTDIPAPVMAFCEARAGSNFKDEDRKTIGANGVGSCLTNVFSRLFQATTADGTQKLSLTCRDNLASKSHTIVPSAEHFTHVYFEPDLARFGMTRIDELHSSLIKQRLCFLAMCYPDISFYFNNEKLSFKSTSQFLKLFSENFILLDYSNFFLAVLPNDSDDFSFLSYVNGLYLRNGGTHITWAMNEIVPRLKERIERKYPNIKPGDIKNKLRLVFFIHGMPNLQFESQTKESISNTVTSLRDHVGMEADDWEELATKLFKNEAIMTPILETYKVKEELKRREELRAISKKNQKLKIEKYLPPIEEKKYLVLAEGDSAIVGISPVLGRREFGYFALRGKPLNVEDTSHAKIVGNEELKNIVQITGIDLSGHVEDMSYERILIASDQDLDGTLIRGLVLTFFNKFAPDLIRQGRVQYLKTPMIALFKNGAIEHYFFSFQEYQAFQAENDTKGYSFRYYKGLGTWETKDLQGLIRKHGLKTFLGTFQFDATSSEYIRKWMGKDYSDDRKEFIRGRSFEIDKL